MIARWMLAALLFAALCGVAAYAVERALRALRLPTRWPWVMALVIGAAWPAIAPFVLTAKVAPTDGLHGNVTMQIIPLATAAAPAQLDFTQLETPLRVAWAMGSALLLLQIALAIRTIRRVQRTAERQAVHGETILVNEHMGPAVIGVLRPRIVVPTWLLELDDSLRALILRHEREHCRAGDPALVWLGVCVTTLFPFNAALWWIARRLRLAMEIDCDARTLRSEGDPSRYAKLLLLIAQHSQSARFVPMLSPSSSQLARRIRAMQNPVMRFRLLRVVAGLGVAGGAGVAACSSRLATNMTAPTPVPASTASAAATTTPAREASASTVTASTEPAAAPATTKPTTAKEPYFDFQVEQAATLVPGTRGPRYPDALRAQRMEGSVLAQYVVNADGRVDSSTIRIVKSTHPDFSTAVRESLVSMRFTPARVGDKAVRQLVQTPFAFSMSSSDATGEPEPVRPSATPGVPSPEEFEMLNHPAKAKAENVGPQYPAALRQAGIKGTVLTQFVVNADGTVEVASLKVLKSDHAEFTQAVRDALPAMRYDPAMVNGKRVRQMLQVPFEFSLDREDLRD